MWIVQYLEYSLYGRILYIETLYRRGRCNEGDGILKLNVYPSHPSVISPYHPTVLSLYCNTVSAYFNISLLHYHPTEEYIASYL
jgi:hypothetical protein